MATTKYIRPRRGTLAQWTAADPVLLVAELVIETGGTRPKFKVGDGVTKYTLLPYAGSGDVTSDQLAGKADKDNAALTGAPTTSSPGPTDDSARIAPTSWVRSTIGAVLTALAGAANGLATLGSDGTVPEGQTKTATAAVRGTARTASSAEMATATATDRMVTPASLQSRVPANLASTVTADKLVSIGAWSASLETWPIPIVYNTTTNTWPARASVVPSWWTKGALFSARTTVNVSVPADLQTTDIVRDLYAS